MLAPWIISHFPTHRVYCEAFGGGASVLLRKPRSYDEIYNDLDSEMVNLFRIVRDRGLELREKLELTPFAREEFKEAYLESCDPLERARQTVIKSFMGFGSNGIHQATGFRFNSRKSGTSPSHDWRNFPECLGAVIERMRGVAIENRDATECILANDHESTLHYVDPPYVKSTRTDAGDDYAYEMDDAAHERLRDTLAEVRGMVIISLYEHPIYDALGWEKRFKKALADGASERTECLYLSPSCVSASQPSLDMEASSKP
jgi:DNA adenine methylase